MVVSHGVNKRYRHVRFATGAGSDLGSLISRVYATAKPRGIAYCCNYRGLLGPCVLKRAQRRVQGLRKNGVLDRKALTIVVIGYGT